MWDQQNPKNIFLLKIANFPFFIKISSAIYVLNSEFFILFFKKQSLNFGDKPSQEIFCVLYIS